MSRLSTSSSRLQRPTAECLARRRSSRRARFALDPQEEPCDPPPAREDGVGGARGRRPTAVPVQQVGAQRQAPPPGAVPSIEEIVRQHVPRIYSLARRMLGNAADIEDVVQDVLLQVVRKLDSFRGEAELTTWLHRVTINAALLHRRKNAPRLARQVRAPLEQILDHGRGPAGPGKDLPERWVLDQEVRRVIEQAIDRLPEMYRDAFVLSDVEGLSNAEIGDVLRLSLAAVKSRLHRARLLLRDALAPYFREGFPG